MNRASVSDASNIVVGEWGAFRQRLGLNFSAEDHPQSIEDKIADAERVFTAMAVLEGMDTELDEILKGSFSCLVTKLLND